MMVGELVSSIGTPAGLINIVHVQHTYFYFTDNTTV